MIQKLMKVLSVYHHFFFSLVTLTLRFTSQWCGRGCPSLFLFCVSWSNHSPRSGLHHRYHWSRSGTKWSAPRYLGWARTIRANWSTWTQTTLCTWRVCLRSPDGLFPGAYCKALRPVLPLWTGARCCSFFRNTWFSSWGNVQFWTGISTVWNCNSTELLHAFAPPSQSSAMLCVDSSGWSVSWRHTSSLSLL